MKLGVQDELSSVKSRLLNSLQLDDKLLESDT